MRRPPAGLPVAVVLALATLAGCSTDGADPAPAPARTTGDPASSATAYDTYVALGDSYTAAPLVPPTDTSTVCLRSGVNYPALVAEAMPGTALTDVSCSGASTANARQPQRGRTGSVPPQLDAVERGTDLVTISLGGNDENLFGTLLLGCTRLAADEPTGSPCTDRFADRVAPVLVTVRDNLARVVRDVHDRARQARVLVVGYPQIVPASGTCDDLPLAPGDYAFARDANERLTEAVHDAADYADAEYVDVWAATEDHDICADDPWINGRVTSAARALAYHPLDTEQRAVADLVLETIG
ncbi:SGNH/GDSL hydrolase family protein [Nocardioides sp. YIM 152315]|uniref:SGNH/GDSL hydrolase family protein n=1 Tax=Nocardioides sp. YIM 152315 TaxID=3031760 RepID=UPI0023DC5357|nr:SGNH/GDSL hydrolase family protein [Nocardioides sp. YIM 152315]MDF1604257.1 SGNH/GDSL hydrolase family protein [Nocardioides sp. YIM 152315]